MIRKLIAWITRRTSGGIRLGCYEESYRPPGYDYDGLCRYPDYFCLLNLGPGDRALPSLRSLAKLSARSSWHDDTVALLKHVNWRYHLAPLVSYLATDGRLASIEDAIWQAVADGSWVSPQLLAGLKIKGFEFERPLKALLARGVHRPDLPGPMAASWASLAS
jgi:hypothetical protein